MKKKNRMLTGLLLALGRLLTVCAQAVESPAAQTRGTEATQLRQ